MMNPNHPEWHSYIESPLRVDDEAVVTWSDEADVIIVGFGGAGAVSALQAAECGADVLAIDRFDGGGATRLSGGVVYAGGTPYQRDAGIDDSPDNMFAYLQQDTGGGVSDETLRRFCDGSAADLEWLTSNGLQFKGLISPVKCYYPAEPYYLYHSGNELHPKFQSTTNPAARGHRTYGPGWTGYKFYEGLRDAALGRGVRLLTHSPVMRLVINSAGEVIGVEVGELRQGTPGRRRHERLANMVNAGLNFFPDLARKIGARVRKVEKRQASRRLIRARRGVVIAAGSYSYNVAMRRLYAPTYERVMSLGTLGCDGSGIRLGESVGGATGFMGSVTAWRSLQSEAYFKGVIVNSDGHRFINEDTYTGTLGCTIGEDHQGKAWLILDREAFKESRKSAMPGKGRHWFNECLATALNLISAKKSATIAGLAKKCGITPAILEATIKDYNRAAHEGYDPLGKSAKLLIPLHDGPFYAIDISIANPLYPTPSIPMGGLRVDERNGMVLKDDGTPVGGLYAAGRCAVGLPSKFYVSGMALADCVFSGRRAGRASATGGADA